MTALHRSMLMRVTEIHLPRFMILSAVTWRRIKVRVFPSPPAWDLFPNTCMESGTGFEGLPLQLGEVPADLSWPPSGNMGSQKIPLKPGLWGFSSHLLREGTTRGSLSIRVIFIHVLGRGQQNLFPLIAWVTVGVALDGNGLWYTFWKLLCGLNLQF